MDFLCWTMRLAWFIHGTSVHKRLSCLCLADIFTRERVLNNGCPTWKLEKENTFIFPRLSKAFKKRKIKKNTCYSLEYRPQEMGLSLVESPWQQPSIFLCHAVSTYLTWLKNSFGSCSKSIRELKKNNML